MHLMLLATEAADAGGGTGLSSAVVVSLILALAVFAIAFFVVGPGRRKDKAPRRRGDIPLAMRPHHSDEELETTGLERSMAWGMALSLFAATFIGTYWLIEPARINNKQDEFYREDIAQGQELFQTNCATCHGADLGGGSAPNPYNADAPWPAPNLSNIQARYDGSDVVTDVPTFMTNTIKQGRAGTPMPAWGAAFQGPLNDRQIDTIVSYILAEQNGNVATPDAQAFTGAMGSGEAIFQSNCARCHGANLEGRVGPQLQNVFERYGWEPGDAQAKKAVEDTIRQTVTNGRFVPTGPMMPSFAHVLPDDAISAVIDYLYSQQQTGGPAFGQLGGSPGAADDSEG